MNTQDLARFYSHTRINEYNGCLEWQACVNPYGVFSLRGKAIGAHIAIMLHHTNADSLHGLLVCHHCDNKICVKIEHLFLGTYTDNNRDKSTKSRVARIY